MSSYKVLKTHSSSYIARTFISITELEDNDSHMLQIEYDIFFPHYSFSLIKIEHNKLRY